MSRLTVMTEMWSFLRMRRKWWMTPIIAFLLLVGLLTVLAHGSALAPFIYTVF